MRGSELHAAGRIWIRQPRTSCLGSNRRKSRLLLITPMSPLNVSFSLVWRQKYIKEIWEVLSSQELTNCRKGGEEEREEESVQIHSVKERFSGEASVPERLMQYLTS